MVDSGILMVFGVILVMMLLLCVGIWVLALDNSRLNKRIDEISEEMDTIKLKMDEIM